MISKTTKTKEIKTKPKISVVILSYNFEKYLPECIDSILTQTLQPYEIIICDDHSMDGSWDIVQSYQKTHPEIIRSYRHKKNMGPFANGTFCGKLYTGDLICLMDGDDRWLPEKLEKEWNALENNPGAQIAYSNVNLIDENGKYIKSWYEGKGRTPPSGDLLIDVFSKCFFPNTKSLFRNELVTHHAFQKEGHCDENLESYWDWERKIRYAARFPIAYSGETLVEYRKHDASFSKNFPDKHFKAFVQVYEKHLPLLKSKTFSESIYVKANLETYIAKSQQNLFKTENVNYYSPRNVYRRNQSSLKKISNKSDRAVKKELSQLLSKFISKSIKYDMRQGNRNEALKSWFLFFMNNIKNSLSYRLLIKIIVTSKSNR
jgi:glycosyltransferase involved in cell wall biosynthesis